MVCEMLEWDSQHFGFPISRISTPIPRDALDWCAKKKVRCAYLLINSSDQNDIDWAEANGFGLRDIRVTLNRVLADIPLPSNGVRTADGNDSRALVELASLTFQRSRFFCDANFPRDRSRKMFEIWMERSIDLSGELRDGSKELQTVLVTGSTGNPTGFITCSVRNGMGKIELFGVTSAVEGKGVASELLASAFNWFCKNGAESAVVVTQGRSVAAQRAYQKSGFRVSDMSLWFHRWFS